MKSPILVFSLILLAAVAETFGAGATVPFTTYYSDSPDHSRTLGNGAIVVTTDTTNPYVRLETGHHAYVKFPAGTTRPYIAFTVAAAANTIVVRYSLPYAPNENHNNTYTLSLYIDNVLQPTPLTLSLKYIHADENGNNDDAPATFWPAATTPVTQVQRWWAETILMLGTTVQPGARIKLQKDTTDLATEYYLDTIDLEQAPAPLAMPTGAIDITTKGAVAGTGDPATNTAAILAALAQAKLAAPKTVWIPVGHFNVNPTITLDAPGVTIAGAGMWYSTLRSAKTDFAPPVHLFAVTANNVTVKNVRLDFAANSRRSQDGTQNGGHHFFVNSANGLGNALWLENIWFRHGATPAWYYGSGATFLHNRVRETYADSFHLQDGASNNLITQNHSRGIGDDGIVQWSNAGAQGFNNEFSFNTVEAQYQGRGIAFFGGNNVRADSNLITGGNIVWGLLLRPEVKSVGTAPIVGCTVTNNVIDRAGLTSTALIKADYASVDASLTSNTFTHLPANGIVLTGTKKITATVTQNDIGHPALPPYTHIDSSGATNPANVLVTSPNTLR